MFTFPSLFFSFFPFPYITHSSRLAFTQLQSLA
jgi:hypothetical protein